MKFVGATISHNVGTTYSEKPTVSNKVPNPIKRKKNEDGSGVTKTTK